MPRKKKEFSEEENLEVEEILEEVSEEITEEAQPVIEEKEEEITIPDKHEYRILFLLSGNNAVAVRKEDGRTISRTIPRTKDMKVGSVIIL